MSLGINHVWQEERGPLIHLLLDDEELNYSLPLLIDHITRPTLFLSALLSSSSLFAFSSLVLASSLTSAGPGCDEDAGPLVSKRDRFTRGWSLSDIPKYTDLMMPCSFPYLWSGSCLPQL